MGRSWNVAVKKLSLKYELEAQKSKETQNNQDTVTCDCIFMQVSVFTDSFHQSQIAPPRDRCPRGGALHSRAPDSSRFSPRTRIQHLTVRRSIGKKPAIVY